jgi:multidrug resistance efflux pump
MLEILLCSLITVLPDYLYRRYGQGKRIGKEITVFSVWYELRWGITACLMLAVALITVVFYNHPSTKNVTAYFRVIPIVPEASGRVAEVFVNPLRSDVSKGDPIFRLDDSRERAAAETARRRLAEAVASLDLAKAELATADARIQQAKSDYQQVLDELQTKQELLKRNADTVPRREIERLTVTLEARDGAVNAAIAQRDAAVAKVEKLAPAQKASAEAALEQAEVELRKTVVSAGVDGRIEQFTLKVGDIVNPFMRPAGVLIPKLSGRGQLYAGFSQIEAQVMRPGMIAEVACLSKPFTVIPMVVTSVQDFIAAGQLRTGDQLLDAQQVVRPGTLTVAMEPLYEGGLVNIPPGSSCIANAYSSNHDRLKNEKLGFFHRIYLHGVDAVAVVHAMLLRIQALVMPVKALVGGH